MISTAALWRRITARPAGTTATTVSDGSHQPAAGPQQTSDAGQLPLRSTRATHQQNATPDAGRTANRQAGHYPVRLGGGPPAAGGARGRAADLCLKRSGQLRPAGTH